MYKKSQEKSNEILRLYREGVELTKICELTTSSQPTVKKVLAFFEIDYDTERKKEYQDRLEKVVQLYDQGKSQGFIEKELNLTRKTIRELLKSRVKVYRDKSDQQYIRCATELDHNCFDTLTPEVLYWIGLLYADGHINKDGEYSISLTLHNDDKDHLEKFRSFLKTNREVKPDNGDCSRIRFNSKRIYERLKELGFTHNKSTTIFPHRLLKGTRDFWRGVVDGDGGVYDYGNKDSSMSNQVFLCGTLETIFDFIIFCGEKTGVKDKYPSKCPGKKLYRISYYGQDAIKVSDLLYKDSSIYLERKYNKYQELINSSQLK